MPWGIYCEREHRVLKHGCEYCDRDCQLDLLEPPFESEYVEGEYEEFEPEPIERVLHDREISDDDIPF